MADLEPLTDGGTGAERDSTDTPSDPPPHLRNPLIGWRSVTLQGADCRGPPGGGSDVTFQSLTASPAFTFSTCYLFRELIFLHVSSFKCSEGMNEMVCDITEIVSSLSVRVGRN